MVLHIHCILEWWSEIRKYTFQEVFFFLIDEYHLGRVLLGLITGINQTIVRSRVTLIPEWL